MGLHVVKEASLIEPGAGTIVLRSDQKHFNLCIEELHSPEARRAAIKAAADNGLGDASVDLTMSSAYPVDADGTRLEKPGNPIKEYRIDIPVTARRAI